VTTNGTPASARSSVVKLGVFFVVAALFVFVIVLFRNELSLNGLAAREEAFIAFRDTHPVAVYGIAFGIYVAVAGLSLPGATGLTLLFGWLFGFWRGLILVSFASTAGATVALLLSRYLLRDSIERQFGDRLAGFRKALEREGAFYLFTLRLIVAVPFFVVNLVMGLTPIRTWTFWWVSQLGMLPGTCVYVYAGSQVPTFRELANNGLAGILTPQIGIAFALLGIFPIAVKKVMARVRPMKSESAP